MLELKVGQYQDCVTGCSGSQDVDTDEWCDEESECHQSLITRRKSLGDWKVKEITQLVNYAEQNFENMCIESCCNDNSFQTQDL